MFIKPTRRNISFLPASTYRRGDKKNFALAFFTSVVCKMDNGDEGISLGGPKIDLTKVPALNQRRSVTFFNHFVLNSVNFLNDFSTAAEKQLAEQDLELQKLEIALNILEAKLSSIPGLDKISAKPNDSAGVSPTVSQNTGTAQQTRSEVTPSNAPEPPSDGPPPPPQAEVENVITVKKDPRYAKYLKMVNVGVPKVAIENKMKLEGLDPALLDTPDAPVPDSMKPEDDDDSDNESRSLSSDNDFSD